MNIIAVYGVRRPLLLIEQQVYYTPNGFVLVAFCVVASLHFEPS